MFCKLLNFISYVKWIFQTTPKQYVECYIAEQNLVGVAIGAACRDRAITFASTFAAFFTRAFDQVCRLSPEIRYTLNPINLLLMKTKKTNNYF